MKKIIRLTESDLARIVRRVIKEESLYGKSGTAGFNPGGNNPITLRDLDQLVARGGTETQAFQDFMDAKGPWVVQKTGMKTKVNKGTSYGKFGPQTTAAYQANKKDYCYHRNSLLGVDIAKVINACK